MILVRNCFTAKPGQATKLANQLREATAAAGMNARILTDVTGDFNRVIMEFEGGNMGEFEARMQEYMSNSLLKEKMAGYTDLWTTGYREILKIW